MFALFKKEISAFFSSLIGYIAIGVFLLANGLFLWVFSGETNVFDSGYASIDGLFSLAPWVFLFLVPAITMRLLAEEVKSGTMELLLTHPLSDVSIIMAKFFAGLVIILLSLLPTLVYFFSVYALGSTVGNIDTGGTWGSYIGLFFLATIYASVGVFSSSLTDNQIVAFIVALVVSFFLYAGFDSISTVGVFKNIESVIVNIGISEHYRSMSRGVIDTRDVIYFLSLAGLFLYGSTLLLKIKRK